MSGISALKRLDGEFATYEPALFSKSQMHTNRAMATKDQESALDESLKRMIIRLQPYLQHSACKQVLEWLIHKYQVRGEAIRCLLSI